jgi:hypothetical protein
VTYYLATPVFAMLDLALGLNLRVTFLGDAPALRLLYYGFAFGCGAAMAHWPGRTAIVGLIESGANIALLVIGVSLTYLRAVEQALSEVGPVAPPFGTPEIVNLVISALALSVSYIAAQARLRPGAA